MPQCVANSFCEWITAWDGSDFTIAHPPGYDLDERFTAGACITNDQAQALKDADFVYVKNWSSYKDYGKILENENDWMLTNEKLSTTNDAKIMHCLPVRRNVELSDEVLDSSTQYCNTTGGEPCMGCPGCACSNFKQQRCLKQIHQPNNTMR